MNDIPKIVFSKTLQQAEWKHTRIVQVTWPRSSLASDGTRQGHPGHGGAELRNPLPGRVYR